MEVIVKETYEEVSRTAARIVARSLNAKPDAVLGLVTGRTPLGMYRELIGMHQAGALDFSQVTTFNADEFVGLARQHPQSYHYYMHENFFKFINIPKQNVYMPSGTADNYAAFCAWYERRISECHGIDLQVLGIGTDGHIAFNGPTSSLGSRTRIKTLDRQTIEENRPLFDPVEEVPVYAITMGVGTILEARELLLLATGADKAPAVAAMIEGPVTSLVTASALQLHPNATVVVDRAAAGQLKLLEYYQWVQTKMPDAP